MGGPYQRTAEEGGGATSTYPFEIWRYRHIEGIGQELEIEFVDSCECGAYHITLDRGEKDVLSHVSGAGPTLMESMGLADRTQRFRGGLETLGPSLFGGNRETTQFDRLIALNKMDSPPAVRSAGLRESVLSTVRYNVLPFDVRVDFARADATTTIVPITVQVPNGSLTYTAKDGVHHASVIISGWLTSLTGQAVGSFEDPVRLDIPAGLLEKVSATVSLYQQTLPLHPGRYRLDVVLKDVNSGNTGLFSRSIMVPDFNAEDKLAASSLILADLIEPVRARDGGPGSFTLGASRVRPRVAANGEPAVFVRGEKINLWMQVYNLGVGVNAKPSTSIEYQVVNAKTNQPVAQWTDTAERLDTAGNQMTLRQSLPPDKLEAGVYQVTVKVDDRVSQQSISTSAKFVVK